jgi:ABC-type multidrug transport system fused ATPase/permease subunit
MKMKTNHVLPKFIKFTWGCHKSYYIVIIISSLILSIQTIFNAYSLSLLISYLEKGEYNYSLIAGGVIVGINFAFYFLNKLMVRLKEVSSMKMEIAVNKTISDKLMRIPFQYLEDPYYLDLKERAKMGINNFDVIYRLVTNGATFIQNLVSLVGLASIIALFDYRVVIVLVCAILFNVIVILVTMKTQLKFFNDLVPINRKFAVYIGQILNERNAKDFRNYPVGQLMADKYKDYESQIAKNFASHMTKLGIVESITHVINYAQMAFVYILVGVKTLLEKLPISSFSLYVNAAISFSKIVTSSIECGTDLVQCIQYVSPLIELIELENVKDQGKKIHFDGKIDTLEFKHVTFSYPKSNNVIIDDVSFKINKGEKISIVGLNGAGKTTLVKLICRLYNPNSGEILINGINILDYEYDSYIRQISAVFQDFKLFAYTLKENILNGDGDEESAYQIACKVGLKEKIDSLEEGINSLYTKSYDEKGIELSGGEAQKIAIGRALHANSSLVILDEPTSALDPLAEADIYQNFNDLVEDKTAIYISHRMSSSVFCSRILVLDGGKVSSFDTHKNLMKNKDSLYYKLFMAQAKNYAK